MVARLVRTLAAGSLVASIDGAVSGTPHVMTLLAA